jgi:hypothetical protein
MAVVYSSTRAIGIDKWKLKIDPPAEWYNTSVIKIIISGTLTFIPSLFFFLGVRFQVSGVSVQDMLLCLSCLTPETKFSEQKRCKKLNIGEKAAG